MIYLNDDGQKRATCDELDGATVDVVAQVWQQFGVRDGRR
jgi:hypothetical protein